MSTRPEGDVALEALLATRRDLSASDRAAVDALRGDGDGAGALPWRYAATARAAMAAAAARGAGVLSLTIRAIGARLEALLHLGRVLEPVVVRGDGPGGLLVAHRIGEAEIATHVDVDDGRFVVMLDVSGQVADDARWSISRGGRELASEVRASGRWLLPRLEEGVYRIEGRGKTGTIAELDLVLERSSE